MPKIIGMAAIEGNALPVPDAVDWRQAEMKLSEESFTHPLTQEVGTRLEAVYAWVEAQPAIVQIEFRRARELRRDHPMVGIMGLFFGLDSEGLDQWFREAFVIGPTVAS